MTWLPVSTTTTELDAIFALQPEMAESLVRRPANVEAGRHQPLLAVITKGG